MLPLRVGVEPTRSCLGILSDLFSLRYNACKTCDLKDQRGDDSNDDQCNDEKQADEQTPQKIVDIH